MFWVGFSIAMSACSNNDPRQKRFDGSSFRLISEMPQNARVVAHLVSYRSPKMRSPKTEVIHGDKRFRRLNCLACA